MELTDEFTIDTGSHELNPGLIGFRVAQSFIFCVAFYPFIGHFIVWSSLDCPFWYLQTFLTVTDVINRAGIAYMSGAAGFITNFLWRLCCSLSPIT